MTIDMNALERASERYSSAEVALRSVLDQDFYGSAWQVDTATLREIARETGTAIERSTYRSCYTESVKVFGIMFFTVDVYIGEPKEVL